MGYTRVDAPSAFLMMDENERTCRIWGGHTADENADPASPGYARPPRAPGRREETRTQPFVKKTMAAAGVGRPGQQRGIGRPGILDWPQPEQQVPSRQVSAAPAAAAAPTDLRAHYLAAASAVSSAGYARSAPQEDSGRHQEGIDHRKAAKEAFLAGRQPVAGEANRVGVGAFAEVRCATGPDGRRMAVKTYEGLRDNPAAAEQVEAEAALAGLRLQHANIFAPEAVRRAAGGDRAEVWMALAEGGSLGDLIKRAKYGGGAVSDTRLGEAAARALFLGVADGVAYLHSMGVCHRDIKLGNVVLDADNAPRLIDFGCARWGEACLCAAGVPVPGTIAYMPPETLRGEAHDGRGADVWALGVLLYNLLERGEFPFGHAARDEAELKAQICGQLPSLPGSLGAHISPGCRDLLGMLLDKDPARRIRAADVRRHPWAAAAAAATAEPSAQPLVERVAALQVGPPPVMKRGGGAGLAGRPSALGSQR